MNKIEEDKYYVIAIGWKWLPFEEFKKKFEEDKYKHVYVCDTLEEAFEKAKYFWEEILDSDEGCIIYHDGQYKEDYEWGFKL